MSDYERTSQICTFSQIQPILRVALQQEAAEHGCGQIPADILICLETISQRKPASIFTHLKNRFVGLPVPGSIQHNVAVITPGWLIWAFTCWHNHNEAISFSIRLDQAEISDYQSNHLIEDYGLNILGISNGSTKRSLKFLGLGPGADSERFKQLIREASQKSRD